MIFLVAEVATQILEALNKAEDIIEVSLDLGISMTELTLADYDWDIDKLEKIVRDPNTVFFLQDNEFFKAAIQSEHFYKLHHTKLGKPPALLIDGVLMHRIKDIDPMTDAKSKAALCAKRRNRMLEICTGLGYSSIACLEREIASITTIEREKDVLKLAELNPWSQQLYSDARVQIVNADAIDSVSKMESSSFHSILHDPPRFTMGSELYTVDFYHELYRLLKPKGVLFHYVGSPGSKHRRRDLPKGVIKRLRDAGFQQVKREPSALGVSARKVK